MRILILVDCYFPSSKSSAKLVHDLAAELARRGHEPIVLTPSDFVSVRVERKIEDGITCFASEPGKLKAQGKWQRGFREARLSSDLWRSAELYLRENPCELILFYSPTIFFGSLVQRLKNLWHCPAYMILRDIFPDWAVDAKVLRSSLVERYFRRVAARQYRAARCDRRPVTGEPNAFHQTDSRTSSSESRSSTTGLRTLNPGFRGLSIEKTGSRGKTVFLYGGNIGVAQDIDNLLRPRRTIRKAP